MRLAGKVLLLSLLVILITSLSAQLAWGQSGSTASSVTGTTTDEQGAIIPGVAVTARNLQTNFVQIVQYPFCPSLSTSKY